MLTEELYSRDLYSLSARSNHSDSDPDPLCTVLIGLK